MVLRASRRERRWLLRWGNTASYICIHMYVHYKLGMPQFFDSEQISSSSWRGVKLRDTYVNIHIRKYIYIWLSIYICMYMYINM